MELSVFLCLGRCKSLGLNAAIPLIGTSAIWGQYPVFHILSSLGLPLRSDCNLVALRSQAFFLFLSVLGAHQIMVEGWNR